MKIFGTVLLVLMVGLTGFAQGDAYVYPAKVPAKYKIDAIKDYNTLRDTLKRKRTRGRDISRYAEAVCFGKEQIFSNGRLYFNLDKYEEYVNKIAQKLYPNEKVKLFLARSPMYNAFAIHDGSLMINAGLLSDVENEAALAAIIGHEIAHFVHADSKNSFFNNLRLYTKRNRNSNFELQLDRAHGDQMLEHAADSLGFILVNNAGYDVSNAYGNFVHFLELEAEVSDKGGSSDKGLSTEGSSSKKKSLSSHPETEARIERLDAFMEANEKKGTADFLVSESTFNELQSFSRLESLRLLLERNAFEECMRRAFFYHLFEPKNKDYMYFILESLRRELYLDANAAYDGFITLMYDDFEEGVGILDDLSYLVRDSSRLEQIVAKEYLDTANVAFNTNLEAYEYFENMCLKNKVGESYLTMALFHADSAELKEQYIQKYLKLPSPKYASYAKSYQKNRLSKDLRKNTRDVMVLGDVVFIEDHFYGYRNAQLKASEKSPAYIADVRDMVNKEFSGIEMKTATELKEQDFAKYNKYMSVVYTTSVIEAANRDQGASESEEKEEETFYFDEDEQAAEEKRKEEAAKERSEKLGAEDIYEERVLSVDRLNPEFWTFMRDENLRTMRYMEVLSIDDRTKLMNLVNLINPFYYYNIMQNFVAAYVVGSYRFAFEVRTYTFSVEDNVGSALKRDVNYKMTKPHLKNIVYYVLKDFEK